MEESLFPHHAYPIHPLPLNQIPSPLPASQHPTLSADQAIQVWFDGSCPLCRTEIAVYRGLPSTTPVQWLDISNQDTRLPEGLSRSSLMARFHVLQADGRVLSGARAFVALWQRLPGWKWLAAIARFPGALAAMEAAYRGFLMVRPLIQRIFRGFDLSHLPATMVGDIRSDQAGETGAVWIYLGILAVTRDAQVRVFAREHLRTERQHLVAMNALLPIFRRSKLLIFWRIAGFLTGAIPSVFGPRAVFATIEAVERFVESHYQGQITQLSGLLGHDALRSLLIDCQTDEREHRLDAMKRGAQGTDLPRSLPMPMPIRMWCRLVGSGSEFAVKLARVL